MASKCRCLSVHDSTSRFFTPYACSALFSTSCNLRVKQPSVFLAGQRLQSQRLQPSLPSSSRLLVQCVSSTFDSSSNNGDERQVDNGTPNNLDKAIQPVRTSPWAKAGNLFLRSLLNQFWIVGKWLAIPVLALSLLNELLYTLLQEKVLIIPVGLFCGIVFAGIMKETALVLSPDIEEKQIPWHLIALGLLFVAFKAIGPYLPTWGQVSVPHFANGGLLQVIKFVNDWRKQQPERKTVEQS